MNRLRMVIQCNVIVREALFPCDDDNNRFDDEILTLFVSRLKAEREAMFFFGS
jgi:hypothetical protein